MSYHAIPIGTVSKELLPWEVPVPSFDWASDAWSSVEEHAKQSAAMGPAASTAAPAMQKGLVAGAAPTTQYPWAQYSAATLALQKQLNSLLRAKGLCPVGEDGKLGAGTCSAAKMFGTAPSTCQSFSAVRSCTATTQALPPVTPANVTASKIKSRNMMYVAGVAVAVFAFVLLRKKGSHQ